MDCANGHARFAFSSQKHDSVRETLCLHDFIGPEPVPSHEISLLLTLDERYMQRCLNRAHQGSIGAGRYFRSYVSFFELPSTPLPASQYPLARRPANETVQFNQLRNKEAANSRTSLPRGQSICTRKWFGHHSSLSDTM